MMYDKEYYQSVNYTDYAEREDRYLHTAIDVEDLLKKVNLINSNSLILDFGCGFGFLAKAFLKLGYKATYAYEISQYAKNKANDNKINLLSIEELKYSKFNILFVLDVFEHMFDKEIHELSSVFSSARVLIARIPVAEPGENNFHLDVSRRDKTHINCKNKNEWTTLLKQFGYSTILDLNLSTIYSSTGVFCPLCIK